MSIRVAHFLQRYPPALGGSEAYFARLGRYLTACGDRVTVFTSNALDLEAFWSRDGRCLPSGISDDNGVSVCRYRLWHCPGRRYVFKALSFVPWRPLQRLAVGCNPICPGMWRDAGRPVGHFDAVHATAFPYTFPIVCGLRLARRLGVPFLLTPFLHLGDPLNPLDRTRRAYTAPALLSLAHAADAIFAQTAGERDALLASGIPAARVILQGLGVDAAECSGGDRAAARRQWGAVANEVVVGHLANNSEEKGTVDLLRAAEMLWRRGRRFRVILAGPEMPNFCRFWDNFSARMPGLPVKRLGVLSEDGKRDFFAGLDVFALPSRSDSFGLVLLEAWANGLPNLAYRAGGVAELIRDDVDGLLVGCGDMEGLAAALERLVDNAELRYRLGRAGQERLATEFRWEAKLDLVREVIRERVTLFSRLRVSSSALR
ncbi:MAG TPA: glycosyltransferase family 4 protein [Gemmataceae bacterium]|nr:glycosyltransferase family 4 protein [Gemmataceae bacterium]